MPRKADDTSSSKTGLSDAGRSAARTPRTKRSAAAQTYLVRVWRDGPGKPRQTGVFRGTVSDLRGAHIASFSCRETVFDDVAESSGFVLMLRRDDVAAAPVRGARPK